MKNKRKILIALLVIFLFCFIASPTITSASDTVGSLLKKAANSAQYDINQTSLPVLVGRIIRAFLSLLGVIFIGLMIYGGYLWMSARGDTEQVKKAQNIIRDSIIGLVIIVAAYAITYFVLYYIAQPYTKESGF
ncbi:MAG: hypothetical protein ABH830_02210 [Patescibacteria group bacterium]